MKPNSSEFPRSEVKYRLKITQKHDRVIIHLPRDKCTREKLPHILFLIVWLAGWGILGCGSMILRVVDGRADLNLKFFLVLGLVVLCFLFVAMELIWTLRGGVRECVVLHNDELAYCANGVFTFEKAKVARTEMMPKGTDWTIRVMGTFGEFQLGKILTREEGQEIQTWLEDWRRGSDQGEGHSR